MSPDPSFDGKSCTSDGERNGFPRGAYGLRLHGLPDAHAVLGAAAVDWPVLTVRHTFGTEQLERESLGADGARVRTSDGGFAEVDRRSMTASLVLRSHVRAAEVVHPFLSTTCAIVSRWFDRDSFHAGAFVAGGGAWLVVGDKGRGKSSTMAWLSLQGHPILADDLVVVDDGYALAGPRCIDLRPDAAEQLGVGEPLGVVGARERWRLSIPGAPDRVPVRGWVYLGWGDRVEINIVPPSQRLARVIAAVALRALPLSAARLLDHVALPMVELVRPRDWAALPDISDALLHLAMSAQS